MEQDREIPGKFPETSTAGVIEVFTKEKKKSVKMCQKSDRGMQKKGIFQSALLVL